MDKLKEELKKKKEEHKNILSLLGSGNKHKFFKFGEFEALKNCNKLSTDKIKIHTADNENFAISNINDENSQDSSGDIQEEQRKANLSKKEVIRRLREREEPIRLFGESDYEAFMRLRKLEMLEPEVNKGFKNDFQDAMDKVDENYMNELLVSIPVDSGESCTEDVKVKNDGTTYEEVLQMFEDFGQGNKKFDSQVILKFLKLILNIWGDELNKRLEVVKRSLKGKVTSATHVQTVNYIKPLFKKLKNQTVSEDIFSCLVDIVKFLLARDYLKANEAYLEMAIGNAPWPIGVTMVGIHARTGREKISARNVAHVLNDETQRKYIQALKRLMTQAQKYFPTNPSRSINYMPSSNSP